MINENSNVLFHWFTHFLCFCVHWNIVITLDGNKSYFHCICSTCFLVGPMKQLKNMFAEKRLIATIIVIISFVCTLIAAIWVILIFFSFKIKHFRRWWNLFPIEKKVYEFIIFFYSFAAEKELTSVCMHCHSIDIHDLVFTFVHSVCTSSGQKRS